MKTPVRRSVACALVILAGVEVTLCGFSPCEVARTLFGVPLKGVPLKAPVVLELDLLGGASVASSVARPRFAAHGTPR